MKAFPALPALLVLARLASPPLPAQSAPEDLSGLEKTAADFVSAYNGRDPAALACLFSENGEIIDLSGTKITAGREAVREHYRKLFEDQPPRIAIEVESVRLITPSLAMEDGTYHLTPADDETAPPQSTSYTAVLTRNPEGSWQIASTRSLKDVTEAAGHLAALADVLKGEWTCQDPDGLRLDLAFGWDPSGRFLTGEMLTTASDAEPQQGSIRIAWDVSKQQIVSWMFDAKGGSSQGVWTPAEQGWLIRSEGSTADGEAISASQLLRAEGRETLILSATHRILNGQAIPDLSLRLVRQAPAPAHD